MLRLLLSLVLSSPAWALEPEVADAVALGQCQTVLTAVPTPSADDERLAVGWCLRRTDPARAATVLAPLTTGVLADYGRWLRAEALFTSGDAAGTVAALQGLTLVGDAGIEIRLLRAKALLALDRSLDARPDLRALLSTRAADEARVLLSDGAVARGDIEPAVATYRRAWATSTRGPWAARAAASLAELGHTVPSFDTAEDRQLVDDRIRALTKANQHKEALALLDQLRTETGETSLTWTYGKKQFRARAYEDAIATWTTVMASTDAASLGGAKLFEYALAHGRLGRYAEATTHYRTLIATLPSAREVDEASFKIGYMAYDEGRCDDAVTELGRHLREHPRSSHADSASWFLARCHMAARRDADARPLLERLGSTGSSLAPGAVYWAARLQPEPAAQRAGLEALLKRFPTSGHAWFAAEQLGRVFPAKPVVPRPAWPAAYAERPAVKRAEVLLAAGFGPWAAAELHTAITEKPTREGALAAAHAYAGDFKAAKALARPYCVSPWKGGDPVAMQACHPRPEASLVSRTAARYGLPPLLPYGIMVAESAMDPSVTSWAGARGLMQLMPAEGQRLHAEALGTEEGYDPDALYLAPYNALLGTTELGLKLKSLDGTLTPSSLPAAIASYNGGEAAVRRWLEDMDAPAPADAFAEAISYTETRRYVRRVLGYLMVYRWVYGDSAEVDTPRE